MSRDQDYLANVSLKLSEVLSDIGVNERMVLKRKRTFMLREIMRTTTDRLQGHNATTYCFGSQSEGSTTPGLRSDGDELFCRINVNLIQDWSQWKPGLLNLLMIQDDSTSPGYCLLQELRSDVPLPLTENRVNMYSVIDRGGKVLRKNSVFDQDVLPGHFRHGPALSPTPELGVLERDLVPAYHCKSWPLEAKPWLERQCRGGWPTEEMKRHCANTGCFVVPVASKSGQNKETEWRISTSHAERYLMFSLNITQIRSYILMKMILKTFINPKYDGAISSYMCKTVLFHCIQNTHSHEWQENNLLPCLTHCLFKLQHFIREGNCPHYIILENNLMAGKIPDRINRKLQRVLQHIIQSDGRVLVEIPIDELGTRLQDKMGFIPSEVYPTPTLVSSSISRDLLLLTADMLSHLYNEHLKQIMCCSNDNAQLRLSGFIFSLVSVYLTPDSNSLNLNKSVCELLYPLLCSSLGSVIASSDIRTNNAISPQAHAWLSAGLSSDVSSGRLKLATALYCGGKIEKSESLLRNIEDQYDQCTVGPRCACYVNKRPVIRPGFSIKSNTGNEEMIKQITAFCVKFMRCEIDCVPKELQYEMFRSTEDDKRHRDDLDCWMDWAVVDSLPYIYFLEYKTYSRLQRAAGQQCVLTYLATTIDTELNLGHRETALNLLGQCMEQENRYNDALRCYVRSLNIRPRNNAAKIHICRVLNELVNRRAADH